MQRRELILVKEIISKDKQEEYLKKKINGPVKFKCPKGETGRDGKLLDFIRCRKCGQLIGQLVEEGPGRSAIRLCVNCGALDFGRD